MQFQSDLLNIPVQVPDQEELSGIGAAYAAGLSIGIYDEKVFSRLKRTGYQPVMEDTVRKDKLAGWQEAVSSVRVH
jgi:glycerol kinase